MMSSDMGEVRRPILWKFFPMVSPGVFLSTMRAHRPAHPFDLSMVAKMMKTSATGAFVMNVLVPLRT